VTTGLALAAACATPAARKDGELAAGLTVGDYYPLAVGNRWTYAGTLLGQKGGRTITVQTRQGPFFLDDAGAQLTLDGDGLRDRDRYLLKGPLAKGTTWTSVVSASSTERYEIVDAGFVADVAAGTFRDCVLVRARNRVDPQTELVNEWTFAPGGGMVRIETRIEKADHAPVPQATMELTAYDVKAK
jgi:hypothetical protein